MKKSVAPDSSVPFMSNPAFIFAVTSMSCVESRSKTPFALG